MEALNDKVRERNQRLGRVAKAIGMDYAKFRTKYLDDVAFHRLVDVFMLAQEMAAADDDLMRLQSTVEDLLQHASEIREASWMEMARGGPGIVVGYKIDAAYVDALKDALE